MADKTALLRENWYDSALYFLHQADFLRLLDVRNIQTISILGAVFSNFGDLNLYYNLLGCAVRIAESLGINNDYTHFTGILPDLRSQRRLWWSLVVLDWLNLPLGQTCISENDFIVELPSIGSDPISERDLDSNNHQAMMCKIAQLLYRFQATLCDSTDWETVEKTVAIADGRIIDLMEELGVGSMEACTIAENPATTRFYGPTQLRNLLLVLFYYRILINRTLIKRPRPSSAKEVTLKVLKVCPQYHKTLQRDA